jgi:hypothetical protein
MGQEIIVNFTVNIIPFVIFAISVIIVIPIVIPIAIHILSTVTNGVQILQSYKETKLYLRSFLN